MVRAHLAHHPELPRGVAFAARFRRGPHLFVQRSMPVRMFGGMHRNSRRVDYAPGFAVITDRVDLARRQSCVNGHRPRVQTADCQQHSRKFAAVFTNDHDSIAGAHSRVAKPICSLRSDFQKLAIRPTAVRINDSFMIGQTVCPGPDNIGDTHGCRNVHRNGGLMRLRHCSVSYLLRSLPSMKATVLFTDAKLSVVTSSSSTTMSKRS